MLASVSLWVGGCATKHGPIPTPPTPPSPAVETVFDAREVAELYNARIAGLDRVWARAVTSMTWIDDRGDRRREQGDGHFMFVEPDRVALTIGAPHRTIFHIGSGPSMNGPTEFWFFDLVDVARAYVSSDGGGIGFAGVPLQPLDTLLLAGLRPLDTERVAIEPAPAWMLGEARVSLVVPVAGGRSLAVVVDGRSGEPFGAELRDGAGRSLRSTLSDPISVMVRGGGFVPPRISSRIEIESIGFENETGQPANGMARITLSDPEISSRRPRAAVFDLEVLKSTYGVEEVVDLDQPAPAQ